MPLPRSGEQTAGRDDAASRRRAIFDEAGTIDALVGHGESHPKLAAAPGTSNHGWALAVDLCGGINRFGTAQTAWMQVNAVHYGWVHWEIAMWIGMLVIFLAGRGIQSALRTRADAPPRRR